MSKSLKIGISNAPRKATNIYLGVADKPRKVIGGWIGVDNKPHQFFSPDPILVTKTFTSSTTWTVPSGVTSVDIFCVGGGGGKGGDRTDFQSNLRAYNTYIYGSYGGGGYTQTKTVSVTAGETLTITVGSYGADGVDCLTAGSTTFNATISAGGAGNVSSVKRGSTSLCSANGGKGGYVNNGTASLTDPRNSTSVSFSGTNAWANGANGGSGSGARKSTRDDPNNGLDSIYSVEYDNGTPNGGGFNGSNGSKYTVTVLNGTGTKATDQGTVGTGQGTTTKAFGESNGTLYATGEPISGMYGSSATSGVVIIRYLQA